MKNMARRIHDGSVFPCFVACLLILAAICLMPERVHSQTVRNAAVVFDDAAVDRLISPSPAFSFSASMLPISKRTAGQKRELSRREDLCYGPRFRGMLSGGIGYGIPAGDWFEGITSGFAAEGALRMGVAKDFFVGFGYKHQWLGVEDSYQNYCYYDEFDDYRCVPLDWDVHLDEFYFLFGWMTPVLAYADPFAYLEFGIGGIEHDMTLGESVDDAYDSLENDEMKFGMLFAVGGVYPLSREIGLNVEADMRLTGEGDEYDHCDPCGDYSGSTGYLFGFKVGLVAMLGCGR